MLELRLFGEPEFRLGDERLRTRLRPRCFSLLGYLIYNAGRAHSRASVAAALWPDEREEDARANLRRHLHLLANGLPELDAKLLRDDGRMLQWNDGAGARVDLIEFERLGSPFETYDRAVALYRGEFLRGYDDEWIFAVRERLRLRLIDMLLALATGAMRHGDFNDAIGYADRLLAEDEWHEEAIRLKMTAMYRRGDRVGALNIFDRFADALKREMSVTPMLDTIALQTSISANIPPALLDRENDTDSSLEEPASALPFIGRDTELARLRSAWYRAARGNGSAAIVQGEAGIGKSRLARELAVLAERQGGCVLAGSTSNPQAQPYQSIVGALRRGLPHLAHAQIDDVWLGSLADLVPEIHGLRPHMQMPEPLAPAHAESRLGEAFARTFGAIARVKPLLVVLEDLQWADETSIAMFSALARRCASVPMMIVATFRSGDAENSSFLRARQALTHEHRALVLSLGALGERDFARIGTTSSAFDEIPSDVIARAAVSGGGNPLFVTLLLQAYREHGELPDRTGAIETVSDAIALRLRALTDLARTIAQAGAVIGRSFDAGTVASIGGWSDAEVHDALDALLDAGIVREANASFEYTFSHALIERALYDALDDITRALRHRRVAAILDRYDDPRTAATVARHWLAAGRSEPARIAYERAVAHALSVYAWAEATRHAQSALALCERDEDRFRVLAALTRAGRDATIATRQHHVDELEALAARLDTPLARMESLLACIDVARHAGKRDRQREACEQLIATARRGRARTYQLEGRIGLAMYHMDLGQIDRGNTLLSDALASLRSGDISPEREAALRAQLGHALIRLGNVPEAARLADAIRPMFATACERRHVVQLDAAVAMARQSLDEARLACREMLAIDVARGDIAQESISHAYLATCSSAWPDDAREHYERAHEIALTNGRRATMLMSRLNRGLLEEHLGRFDLALAYAREAYAIGLEIGESAVQTHALVNESAALRETGNLEAALECARRAHTLLADLEAEPRTVAAALASVGKAQFAMGEIPAAIATLQAAIVERRRSRSMGAMIADLVTLADALLADRRALEAKAVADEISEFVLDKTEDQLRPTALCAVLGAVYQAAHDAEASRTWFERGRTLVSTILARISDEETRAAFRALPYNRFLLEKAAR